MVVRNYRRFVWADLHFGHRGILSILDSTGQPLRPFASMLDMEDHLVARNNAIVKPNDRVYVLGDAVFNRRSLSVLGRMNGRKVLVRGNHDMLGLREYQRYFDDVRGIVVLQDEKIILTHVPVHPSALDERWTGGNIHGHLHEKSVPDARYLCVSVEQTGYAPLDLDVAIQRLSDANRRME